MQIMSLLLHNMSAPPRTGVEAEKRRIADRIVVFSLTYALTVSGLLNAPELRGELRKDRALQDVAWDSSSILRAAIRARWPSPDDLFAQIGYPKTLPITADFLIGWRVGITPEPNPWYFCPDPRLVAGVQARCSGDLYLSRRNLDLRWERLLSAPIAFDEPELSALLL
jgi:hypothetical protein